MTQLYPVIFTLILDLVLASEVMSEGKTFSSRRNTCYVSATAAEFLNRILISLTTVTRMLPRSSSSRKSSQFYHHTYTLA